MHQDDVTGQNVPERGTSRAAWVWLMSRIFGEDSVFDRIWGGWKGNSAASAYIATATTTVVKSGAGVLHSIVLGETAAGAITIYDNTAASGTIICVLKASIAEGSYLFDRPFAIGLTVVTAAASKLHVSAL